MNELNLSKPYLPANRKALKEISPSLNLTRKSIRKIEMKALIKLREKLITKKITSIDQIV